MKLELLAKDRPFKTLLFQVATGIVVFGAISAVFSGDELGGYVSPRLFLALRIFAVVCFGLYFPLNRSGFLHRFWTRKVGTLQFRPDSLVIALQKHPDEKRYAYDQIKKVIIRKRTQPLAYGVFFKPWYEMRLTTGDGEQAYAFLLKNTRDENRFKSVLERLYQQKIDLREYDEYGARAFLLNSNLKFTEVQEIKARYKISW